MGLRFALRSTSLDAHFSYSGKTAAPYGNVVDDPALVVNVNSGVFGGQVINMVPISVTKGLIFPGYLNVCEASNTGAFSVLCRIVPTQTLNPFTGFGCVEVGCSRNPYGFTFRCGITSAGKAYVQLTDKAGNITTYTGSTTIASTVDVPFELMYTWDGTAGAGKLLVSKDGAALESFTSTNTCSGRVMKAMPNIIVGSISAGPTGTKANLNELLIWDNVETYTYSARTDFHSVTAFDGSLNTDPGAATVITGQTYYSSGTAQTGTLDVATQIWDADTTDHVASGTFGAFIQKLLTVARFLGLK